jgi:putative FmdB family regulatory protein
VDYPRDVPVYEYRCRDCGREVDEVQPMGSGPPGPCPQCGGDLRRVWGRVGVRFSGWGFKATDSLVPDDGRKRDYRRLKEKAEEIVDSG